MQPAYTRKKLYRLALVFVLLPAVAALADIPRTLYVMNGSAETLSKMNMEDKSITRNMVKTGQVPNQIRVHNQKLYLVNSGTDDIMVIDPHTDQVEKIIALAPGSNPWFIAFAGSKKAYVTNFLRNSVSVIDLEFATVAGEIPVGVAPEGIIISGNKAFVANTGFAGPGMPYEQATVSIIDILADTVTHNIAVPTNAQDLAIDPMGRVHVMCTGNYVDKFGTVAVIDLYTGPTFNIPAVVDTIQIGGTPGDIEITAAGKGYCVAWGDGKNGFLYSYDATADTVIHGADGPIPVGPNVTRIFYDNRENALWVPFTKEFAGDGFVQKIDVATDSILWTSGIVGNGTQDVAILEPVYSSDPWADAVVSFNPGTGAGFGDNYFPDNILGPPDPDPAVGQYNSSAKPQEILSLGHGGEIVLQFTDNKIVNGTGADFTVFENAFISLWDNSVYMEAGIVSVSQDGETWVTFPYDTTDMSGLAGVTPTNDNQNPTDPAVSGGDQFDLQDTGLEWASYVKITDLGDIYQEGMFNGDFDLDAVVAVNSEQSTIVEGPSGETQPVTFELHQNYPNPFNPYTNIHFTVNSRCHVNLTIFNSLGRRVKTLVNSVKDRGEYDVQWDATNMAGQPVSGGVYFYRLRSGGEGRVLGMVLAK